MLLLRRDQDHCTIKTKEEKKTRACLVLENMNMKHNMTINYPVFSTIYVCLGKKILLYHKCKPNISLFIKTGHMFPLPIFNWVNNFKIEENTDKSHIQQWTQINILELTLSKMYQTMQINSSTNATISI